MRKRKEPEKTQWRDYLDKVSSLATALYLMARFILIMLQLWDKLAG